MGLRHQSAQHNLGMVAACNGAISGALGGLGLEEDAATVARLRVSGDGDHEHENARDKIR
ncbi:hypothetical protein [Micrococcus luteus]|uniref:hypothetical protein n=1 Tax=Micrococcus luteus TaxID=1270 RepID=UPI001480CCB6|nr:hypothetical protein [Micrococcus luteus]NNM37187.1 hypothetical protein [Micrococcus luteus]